MPPVAERPDTDLDHQSIYASQTEHERAVHRHRAAELVGNAGRARARWLQTIAEGVCLFVVVDVLVLGWSLTLLGLGVLGGAVVGQVWYSLRPSDTVCGIIGGGAYVACAFVAGVGPGFMLVIATAIVAGLSGWMARQRVHSAFGA